MNCLTSRNDHYFLPFHFALFSNALVLSISHPAFHYFLTPKMVTSAGDH